MNKDNLKHCRTCVYNCNYHIVFSTKYRKKVLTGEVEEYLKDVIMEIAKEKDFEVSAIETVEEDHIHIFASGHPKISPCYMVKMIKGISGRKLFIKFPCLKNKLWGGHLWNPSYYIETIGSISEEVIKRYIEKQVRK